MPQQQPIGALPPGGTGGEQIGGLLNSMVTSLNQSNQSMGRLIATINSILPFSGSFGTFTLGAAATTTVLDPTIAANSIILLMPTNAAAGTLQGSAKSLYVSARTVGVSFTVATASGASAAGTETLGYLNAIP